MALIGIEWVNRYNGTASDLKNNHNNARGFANALSGTLAFEYGDDLAWDEDFEQAGKGSPAAGTDARYAETVDIAFFSGHGSTTGFLFGTSHDNGVAGHSEVAFGDGGLLKWLVADACEVLNSNGVLGRWGNSQVFRGLHYILGFHTICGDSGDRGQRFAQHLQAGESVRWAWIMACAETEGGGTECAYLRADAPGTDTVNDHWPGKGFVSDHPVNPNLFVHLKTNC